MKSDALRIGMSVKHPIYGTGTVRGLTEQTVEIRFQDGNTRTVSPEASALQPAEPVASVEGLEVPYPLATLAAVVIGGAIAAMALGIAATWTALSTPAARTLRTA